ncbi:hypothetical protein GCM10027164_09430 [Algoriphagus taiwanensis]|uniref:Uncharacterized protein n=1 Tax=Algoriphagus taiwanensis TaxID=1445656 RepID=A0ABQ6PYZ4_9BACT|nr:hypothetical protein Ataiwa_13050 [Algoriphagus taiwanensis]
MEKKRRLIFYKNYFEDFFTELPEKVQGKVDEVLYMVMVLDRIPAKFFSQMTSYDGLYEIRIEYSSNILGFSAVLMKVTSSFSSMVFKKSLKKHLKKK